MFLHVSRYGLLLSEANISQDPLSISVAVLRQFSVPPEMYLFGYTKVYLRKGQVHLNMLIGAGSAFFFLFLSFSESCRLDIKIAHCLIIAYFILKIVSVICNKRG